MDLLIRAGHGALAETAQIAASLFPGRPALIIADPNTFAAAGRAVCSALPGSNALVLPERRPAAADVTVEAVRHALAAEDRVPVAVGSGVISDVTKLAAEQLRRRYLCVATAASMDGYTAFGASISMKGWKQSVPCAAPVAVIADLDVIARAPAWLNASGYGDLMAKFPAGADWLLAEALGVEAIEPEAWRIAQANLRRWTASPSDHAAVLDGLLASGLAMQRARSSRPASGAEHQFSHLWDMQRKDYAEDMPTHGFQVAIGTLAATALYEDLLAHFQPPAQLASLPETDYASEVAAKATLPLERLREAWPELRVRLREQLLPLDVLRERLRSAGCPVTPEEIGISRERLRGSFQKAWAIRRRFTVLDLAVQSGALNAALDRIFVSSI